MAKQSCFKVGDVVEVAVTSPSSYAPRKGSVGVVFAGSRDHFIYVKFFTTQTWVYADDELIRLNPEEISE